MSLMARPSVQEASVAVVAFQTPKRPQLKSEWIVGLRDERTGKESKRFTLIDPFDYHDYEALRWYVEDYAAKDPYAEERAEEISKSQDRYKEELVKTLEPFLYHLLGIPRGTSEVGPCIKLHLSIHGDGTVSSLHSLLWELVERESTSGSTIDFTITRIVDRADHPLQLEQQVNHNLPLNVLYVSARPGLENDISYRAISRDIFALIKRKIPSRELNLQFVRPGTWSKFLEVLHENHDNPFDLVHFDMHGSIIRQTENEIACLHFASAGTATQNADRKSAQVVGKALKKYGVLRAVLNACEAASPISFLKGNFAHQLVSHGVQCVAAMRYMAKSDAAALAMIGIYQSLLDGKTLFSAVVSARVALSRARDRVGRYGTTVKCRDEFNFVYYATTLETLEPPSHASVEYAQALELESLISIAPHEPTVPPLDATKDNTVLHRIQDLDILSLEELLDFNRYIFVTGESGTGKTTLASHLQEWWTETRYADDVLLFHCMQDLLLWVQKADEPKETSGKQRELLLLDTLEAFGAVNDARELTDTIESSEQVIKGILESRGHASMIIFTRCPYEHIKLALSTTAIHAISKPSAEEASSLVIRESKSHRHIPQFPPAELEDAIKQHDLNLSWTQVFIPQMRELGLSPRTFLDQLLQNPESCDFGRFQQILEHSDSKSALRAVHECLQLWRRQKDLSFQMMLPVCMFLKQLPEDPREWLYKLFEIGYFHSGKPTIKPYAVETGEIHRMLLEDGWSSFPDKDLMERSWKKVEHCLNLLGLGTGANGCLKIHPFLPYLLRYEAWSLNTSMRNWKSFWNLIQQGYWEYFEVLGAELTESYLKSPQSRGEVIEKVNRDSINLLQAVQISLSQPKFPFRCMLCFNLITMLNYRRMGQLDLIRWEAVFLATLLRYQEILVTPEWTVDDQGIEWPPNDKRQKKLVQAMMIAQQLMEVYETTGKHSLIFETAEYAGELVDSFKPLIGTMNLQGKRLLYQIQVQKAKSIPPSQWTSKVMDSFVELLESDIPDIGTDSHNSERSKFSRSRLFTHLHYELDNIPEDHPLHRLLRTDSGTSLCTTSYLVTRHPEVMQQLTLSGREILFNLPAGNAEHLDKGPPGYTSRSFAADLVRRVQERFRASTPSSDQGYTIDALLYAMDAEAVVEEKEFVFDVKRLQEVCEIAQQLKHLALQKLCLQQLSSAAHREGNVEKRRKYAESAQRLGEVEDLNSFFMKDA